MAAALIFYKNHLVKLGAVACLFYLWQRVFILIARFLYVSMIFKTESCLRSGG